MGSGGEDNNNLNMTRNGINDSMLGTSLAGNESKYNEDDKKRIADLEAQLKEMKRQQDEVTKMQNKLMSHPEAKKHMQAAMEVAGVDDSESMCCDVNYSARFVFAEHDFHRGCRIILYI